MYYYPHAEEAARLPSGIAVASVASGLLQLAGVAHLRFEGIDFLHSDHWTDVFPLKPSLGGTTDQAGYLLDSAAVHITDSHDVVISNCSVGHTSGYGVWVHGNSSRVEIQSCEIFDIGAGGVRFGDGGAGGPAGEAQAWNLILNNTRVEDGGHVTHGAAGVFVQTNAYACQVLHNRVQTFQWAGISVGQVSSFSNSSIPSTYDPATCTKGMVAWPTNYTSRVAYNEVTDIATGPSRLSDNGGIYSPAINTEFEHNYVHDIGFYNFGGMGIYAEGGGCNLSYVSNVVSRTAGPCYAGHFLNVNVRLANNMLVGRGISSTGGWDNVSIVRNIVDIDQAPNYMGPFEPTVTTRHNIGLVAWSWGKVDSNVCEYQTGISCPLCLSCFVAETAFYSQTGTSARRTRASAIPSHSQRAANQLASSRWRASESGRPVGMTNTRCKLTPSS